MNKAPDLREIPDLPDELVQAALDGEFILFVGAGISMLLDLPSWGDLANFALNELRTKKYLNYAELEQLKSLDPKKKLSIAKLVAEENGDEIDLSKYLGDKKEGNSIYKTINDIGCSCITTNYDELLAPRFKVVEKGDTTKSMSVIRIYDKEEFFTKHLNNPGTVVHLHGSISNHKNMVITADDYIKHYSYERVKYFLTELFKRKKILFIGYSLEEAELLEHILRGGAVKSTRERRIFALQGYFQNQEKLYTYLHEYYQSLGVHLIGFIRDHEDYYQQEIIINNWAQKLNIRKPLLAEDYEYMSEVLGNE